jgi:serine/threonine-protein kinase
MASASIPAQPGETISGKYQIERTLGMGGAGMVVSACHLTLGQTCAIKFLLPNAAHNPHDVQRFKREMRMAARLTSEHVTRVLDAGELQDGSPYLVLEYLEGQDLGAALHRAGPLPVTEAVGYLLQVCEAVAEAHCIGLIHRDLKPANFFLTHRCDGSPLVKVLDFGIAKYLIDSEPQDVSLTQTRALLGSPVYMSPEQVRDAHTADPRSDIWSLGISLFELLTDTVPFCADTVTGVAAAIASDPVPKLTQYRPDLPPKLARVIEKCLEKRPEQRYQTVCELAHALLPFAPPEGTVSAQRISGVLGLNQQATGDPEAPSHARGIRYRSARTSRLDSNSECPTVRRPHHRGHRRYYAAAGLALFLLLALVGLSQVRSSALAEPSPSHSR